MRWACAPDEGHGDARAAPSSEADLSALIGRRVVLEVALRHARLYTIGFAEATTAHAHAGCHGGGHKHHAKPPR